MEREKTGVKVLTVTPYYIATGMFAGVSSPVIPILKPEKVAGKILKAIEQGKIILRLGKLFGIYSSMKTFKGRTHEHN